VRADAERRLDRIEGRPRLIPAGPAKAHLQQLVDAGFCLHQIANETGVGFASIRRLDAGQKQIRRTTAEKVLALKADSRVSAGQVPALGAVRRLRALYALGHPVWRIARGSGLHANSIAKIVSGRLATVAVHADDGIRRAYEGLSMQVGAPGKTLYRAQREGWAPPLAWDEDSIDDPAATPLVAPDCDTAAYDEVAVRRYADGARVDLTSAERLDAIVLCVSRGMSFVDIDRMHGHGSSFTCVFVGRMRRAYEREGRPFPEVLAQDTGRELTEAEVVAIRTRSVAGETDLELGMAYGVRARAVAEVCRGRTYRQYGGPIRAPRTAPSKTSTTLFAGKTGQRAA
jgi:hypothetical protein